MRERFKTGTARTIGFAFVAMAGLSASAARADSIFGASAIFTDRSCAQAADVACQFDAVRGPKLTPNQFFGGYGASVDASASLPGGASTSAAVSFGPDYLPSVRVGSMSGAATRTGASANGFRSFTYTGDVAIDFAIAGELHFITSGDIAGPQNANEFGGDGVLNVNLSLQRVSDITSEVGPGSSAFDLVNASFAFKDCSSGALAAVGFNTNGSVASGPDGFRTTLSLNQSCAGGAIVLNPGDSFVIVATLQALSNRGGFLDATHTFNVKYDEANTLVDSTKEAVAQGFLARTVSEGAAVPEPASWAMMLVGFGGLGAVLRRRRSQVALAA